MTTVRVALPGYNALTDTNPDHYALVSDEDNVLIKSLVHNRQDTMPEPDSSSGYSKTTIPHNLGYIPFFMVHDNYVSGKWEMLNNGYNPFSVPYAIAGVDTKNLYLINFSPTIGHVGVKTVTNIFYDDMTSSGAPEIVESDTVFKVAREGKNALVSKNPNDYIMHSDLNNFRILKQATVSLSIASGFNTYTIAHGARIAEPISYLCFVKFPDGKVSLAATGGQPSYDGTKSATSRIDTTNIYLQTGSNTATTVTVTYLIFSSGKNGLYTPSGSKLAVAKAGYNALTDTNPDHYNFLSDFNTLKYYYSNSYLFTATNTTVVTIAHNLGYVPFFVAFVNDLYQLNIYNGQTEPIYAQCPYYLGQSTIASPNKDIAAYAFADETNLYLMAYYQPNAVGTSLTFQFYYKLFKNNLNL